MGRTSLISIALAVVAVVAAVIVVIAVAGDDEPAAAPTSSSSTTTSADPTTTTSSGPNTTVVVTEGPPQLPGQIAHLPEQWETDWNRRTIELDELVLGIPAADPRDLIRPLDFPEYETVEQADEWLEGPEIGVEFEIEDSARFYPLRILVAHEVVNDEIGGVPFALTYCPLCNTATAFDRRVEGQVLRFGVSGLLRKSDLVMWDDATESLWQQITGEGIVGEHAGTQLEFFPTSTVTWDDFKNRHPDGRVLSRNTGFGFSYGSNGYVGYSRQDQPFGQFFTDEVDPRFPAMERMVGVRVGDSTKAYPFSILSEERVVNDEISGTPITVWWADTGAVDNFDSTRPGEGRVIGTGIAFLAKVDGETLTFRHLEEEMFVDDQTGSTWTLFGEAVDGPLEGTQLEIALHQNEFWFAWAAFNEGSPVHGA